MRGVEVTDKIDKDNIIVLFHPFTATVKTLVCCFSQLYVIIYIHNDP